MKGRIALLLLGLVLGLALALVAPRFWQRLAPVSWQGEPTVGVVESKRLEDRRLLLTVVTDSGALLATFSKRVAEIDLLVAAGDTVALSLGGYRPFVEDPPIQRVVKAEPAPAAAAEPTPVQPSPAAEGPGEAPSEGPEAPQESADRPPGAGVDAGTENG